MSVEREENGYFKPGVSGNPRGRAGNQRGFDPRSFLRRYLQEAVKEDDKDKKGGKKEAEKQRARMLVELMIHELIVHARVSGDADKILSVLKYVTPTDREEKIKETAYKEFSDHLFPIIMKYIPQEKIEEFSADLTDLVERLADD